MRRKRVLGPNLRQGVRHVRVQVLDSMPLVAHDQVRAGIDQSAMEGWNPSNQQNASLESLAFVVLRNAVARFLLRSFAQRQQAVHLVAQQQDAALLFPRS